MNSRHSDTCRLTLPAKLRVRKHNEFQQVMQQGLRVGDAYLNVWGYRTHHNFPRFGLVVGKRHGNAVARNRLRRLLRESFRLSQHELPKGIDFALAPRQGATLTLASATDSLVRLAKKLDNRLKPLETDNG